MLTLEERPKLVDLLYAKDLSNVDLALTMLDQAPLELIESLTNELAAIAYCHRKLQKAVFAILGKIADKKMNLAFNYLSHHIQSHVGLDINDYWIQFNLSHFFDIKIVLRYTVRYHPIAMNYFFKYGSRADQIEFLESLIDQKGELKMPFYEDRMYFPVILSEIPKLKSIHFNKNYVEFEQEEIVHQMPQLQKLTLDGNFSPYFIHQVFQMAQLRYLNAYTLKVERIPKAISKMVNLEVLILNHAKIQGAIPDEFFELKNLRQLDFSYIHRKKYAISKIPRLTSLEYLNIAGHNLKALPSNYKKLTKLKELNVKGNPFKSFPKAIVELPQLQRLHYGFHSNIFPPVFDESILALEQLTYLDLSNTTIDDSIFILSKMKNLKVLSLKHSIFPKGLTLPIIRKKLNHIRIET